MPAVRPAGKESTSRGNVQRRPAVPLVPGRGTVWLGPVQYPHHRTLTAPQPAPAARGRWHGNVNAKCPRYAPAHRPRAREPQRLEPVTAMAGQEPEPARDQPGAWQVLTATERGAAHHAAEVPNQDAVAAFPIGPSGAVAAVADGHGHSRHFRSARGARLAVTVACRAVHDLAPRLDGLAGPGQAGDEMREVLVPGIAGQWRAAVHEDLAADPFSRAEDAARGRDDATIAYGTTLLLAIAWREWLLLTQIGDGDIVGIRPDGSALLPVPGDPQLDGRHTTSLCMPGAESSFRIGVVDTSRTELLGVLLATDGYGNAQAARDWEAGLSADLAGLIATRPVQWLASQLPLSAARCASLDGSADDTTLALILATPSARERAGAGGRNG